MAKVAFIYKPSNDWLGGKNYFLSLFDHLNRHATIGEIFIFTGKDFCTKELNSFDKLTIIKTSVLNNKYSRLYGYCNLLISENILLILLLNKYKIDYLSHSYISNIFGVESIPWIPDFQHCYLPELFSKKELNRRTKRMEKFFKMKNVIVSSYSAKSDAYRFFSPRNNIVVYRFNPLPIINDEKKVNLDFELPSTFLFLPNQFWKHKNHLLLFKAIGVLKQQNINITVLCTGSFSDYRNPGYKDEVIELISTLGLKKNIKLLGMVDRTIFEYLLKKATIVANPSKFEGWSTTVEEGKYSGKRMLLSKIPVHQEQVVDYPIPVTFFDPESVESCIENLRTLWQDSINSIPDEKLNKKPYNDNFYKILKDITR